MPLCKILWIFNVFPRSRDCVLKLWCKFLHYLSRKNFPPENMTLKNRYWVHYKWNLTFSWNSKCEVSEFQIVLHLIWRRWRRINSNTAYCLDMTRIVPCGNTYLQWVLKVLLVNGISLHAYIKETLSDRCDFSQLTCV